MSSWHSPGKIISLGHGMVQDIFKNEVVLEEKIDGSFIAFGIFGTELKIRSKGMELNLDAPEKMFSKAVSKIIEIQTGLINGYTYRGEYLSKNKHNVLAYDRIPSGNIVIFDILTDQEQYLPYGEKKKLAENIGLEAVPRLFEGKIENEHQIKELLNTISILGGQKIEGIVIKNYKRFLNTGHAMFAKYVSEEFKEIHKSDWKERNPGQNDIITRIVTELKTPARFNKAIQHLSERGELTSSPKDIGPLIKETQQDIIEECSEYIKEELFKWGKDQIIRGVTNPIPDYYKELLLTRQFKE